MVHKTFTLCKGMTVALHHAGYLVGTALVVLTRPSGIWMGREVRENVECIVRPLTITSAWCPTLLQTPQDGIACLGDSVGREILWRYVETAPLLDVSTDASSSGSVPSSPLVDPHEHLAVKEEGPSSSSSFVPLDGTPQVDRRSLSRSSWRGMICQLEDDQGLVLAYGRIQASEPEDVFLASLLGEEDVGVIVTSVPSGDDADVMSLRRWPLTETRLLGSLLLVDLISRFYESLSSIPTPTLSLESRRLPIISPIDAGRLRPLLPNLNAFFNSPPFASLARSIAVFANAVNLFRGRKLLLAAPGTGLSPLMSGGSLVGMFPNDCTPPRARWRGS